MEREEDENINDSDESGEKVISRQKKKDLM